MSEASSERTVYEVVGEEGLKRLTAAFYRRVPSDPILGPMYPPDDLAGAEHRLGEFLIYRLGGPERYIAERGHPRLRMRHAPFIIGRAARDRWMQLMTEALDETQLPAEADRFLRSFFDQVATFLINQPG